MTGHFSSTRVERAKLFSRSGLPMSARPRYLAADPPADPSAGTADRRRVAGQPRPSLLTPEYDEAVPGSEMAGTRSAIFHIVADRR
jgi:hypothetical protein